MTTVVSHNSLNAVLNQEFKGFEKVRLEGRKAFEAQQLPTPKAEEYKFTNLTKKIEQSFDSLIPAQEFEVSRDQVTANTFNGFSGRVLVFANGFFLPEVSDEITGIKVNILNDNAEFLGSIAKASKDPFCAVNQTSFNSALSIEIEKKAVIDQPVLLMNFIDPSKGNLIQPRLWLNLGDFSEAKFIEQQIVLNEGNYFWNEVKEIKGGENTHLDFYRIQNEGSDSISMSNIETDIQANSTFTSVNISLSGAMVRNNLNLNLLGSGSEGNMYGLYLSNGKTHIDNHTNVDHTIPHAESNELYKGILADKSRGVFNGKIFVRQDAQKTNAFQQNNNILLSEDAIVNTKPQLEIWADDVKCSHGCTTGQLDEEALFYLQARGIGKEKARGLLLYAFAGEVLEHIKDENFRDFAISLIQERLGTNF